MWLTAGEVAHLMRWSERYVYKLASLHGWRRVREGRTVRYHWHDVSASVPGVSLDESPVKVNNPH